MLLERIWKTLGTSVVFLLKIWESVRFVWREFKKSWGPLLCCFWKSAKKSWNPFRFFFLQDFGIWKISGTVIVVFLIEFENVRGILCCFWKNLFFERFRKILRTPILLFLKKSKRILGAPSDFFGKTLKILR